MAKSTASAQTDKPANPVRQIDRIDALARARKLGDNEIYRLAGLTKGMFSHARKSASGNVSNETLEKLAPILGVSFAELLGMDAAPAPAPPPDPAMRRIPFLQIAASRLNPRRTFDAEAIAELAESIAQQGLLQNLVVRPDEVQPIFWIVAGERRFRALELLSRQNRFPAEMQEAGGVPCRVIEATDAEHLALALLENLQRVEVNPMEEAEGFARLQEIDPARWTTAAIAQAIGKGDGKSGQRFVQQRLHLARHLGPEAKAALQTGLLSFTQARVLAMAEPARQKDLIKKNDRNVPAEILRRQITEKMVAAKHAIFDVQAHPDQLVETPGGDGLYFRDKEAFLTLQRAAMEEKAEELRGRWAFAHIHEEWKFPDHLYDLDQAGPDAGAALSLNQWDYIVTIQTGLKLKQPDEDKAAAAARYEAALQARKKWDAAAAWLRDELRDQIALDPLMAMRLLILRLGCLDRNHPVSWQGHSLSGTLINGGALSKLADFVAPLDKNMGGHHFPPGPPIGAWNALMTWTPHDLHAAIAGIQAESFVCQGGAEISPIALALARHYQIAVPPELLPQGQTDIEDAIAAVPEAEAEAASDIAHRVGQIVAESLNWGIDDLDTNDRFVYDLRAKPIDAVHIAQALKIEFDLPELPYLADPAENFGFAELGFETLGQLVAFMEKRLSYHQPEASTPASIAAE